MSGGGGTTTTKTNTDPWGGQAPFLSNVFQNAANTYNAAQTTGYPVASLYNQYINQAQQSTIPGGGYLEPAYQQNLQALNTVLPISQAIAATGVQQNPYLQQDSSVFNQLQSNTGIAGNLQTALGAFGNISDQSVSNPAVAALFNAASATNPLIDTVGNSAALQTNNPYLSNLLGAGGANNQYIDPLAASGSLAMANPALSQLNQTAAGDYLNPDQNPYLQRAVQSALGQAQSQIASQFNRGSRYGSGQMQDVQSRALGDIASQAYTQQYQQERQNQLAAQQALGSQYLQGTGQLTGALQGAGSLQQGQQGLGVSAAGTAAGLGQQGLAQQLAGYTSASQQLQNQQALQQQALNAAGNQYSTGVGQNLQAWQNIGNIGNQQVQNLLSSLGIGQQGTEAQLNRQLAGQEGSAQSLIQAQQAQNQAMGLAPYLQGLSTQDLQNLQNAANTQQYQLTQPENEMWNRLNQYAALVSGNNWGSAGQQQTPYYNNTAGQVAGGVLGAGSLALGLAALMSSRSEKVRIGSPNVEAIVDGVRTLPIDLWHYITLNHDQHIGPYAEDFRSYLGFGDGTTIPVVDAIGVLFTVVKWLLERTR